MPRKIFIGDLFLNDDYADRKEDLERIRSGIRDKLISRRVQFTENLDEADLVVIFFTRCFLPRSSNLLSRIHDVEGVQHVSIFCDKSHLSAANNELDINRLLSAAMLGNEEKAYELVKDCDPPKLKDQMRSYLTTLSCAAAENFQFNSTTDSDSLVDSVVSCILECVNRFGIDLHKAIGMEPDVFKITDLINKNAGLKTTTRFVVISGCRQTHDISTVTKYLAMEQMPRCDLHVYRDNWPDEFPLTYGEQLFVEQIAPQHVYTDIHEVFLDFFQHCEGPLKFLLVLDGVSSLKQLREIRKLDAIFNDQFPGSIVMLSTDVDAFKEFESYFQSHDSVFLGYVDGAAIADQNASMENVPDSGRPFCLELNALQLGEIIAMADERTAGIPYSIGVMLLNYY